MNRQRNDQEYKTQHSIRPRVKDTAQNELSPFVYDLRYETIKSYIRQRKDGEYHPRVNDTAQHEVCPFSCDLKYETIRSNKKDNEVSDGE